MCQTFQSIVLLLKKETISIIANGQIGRLTLGAKKKKKKKKSRFADIKRGLHIAAKRLLIPSSNSY